jgi:hypothetical protein
VLAPPARGHRQQRHLALTMLAMAAHLVPDAVFCCYKARMAVIVGVHGMSQQYSGGTQLGSSWFDAIRDGLIAAGHGTKANSLAPGDLRVAFFGRLFRPPGALAGQEPPYTAADVAPGLERELLYEWYQEAVAQDPSLGPPPDALGPTRVRAQVMVERLLRSPAFAGVAERMLVGDLKQVTRFLTDPKVKKRVLTQLSVAVGEDTRVLIGHSLGSVVAYEYLCRDRPAAVELLVTLGSPLGIPQLIFDRLTPAPIHGRGAWPGAELAWLNVADSNDVVALRKQLAGLFDPPAGTRPVQDRLVDNGKRPHAIERYLNAAPTGEGLGEVLP